MLLPEQGIRQRKNRSLNEIVQDLDAFNKVRDEIKEERTAGNGLCKFFLSNFFFNSPAF